MNPVSLSDRNKIHYNGNWALDLTVIFQEMAPPQVLSSVIFGAFFRINSF